MKRMIYLFFCLFSPYLLQADPTDLDTSFDETGYIANTFTTSKKQNSTAIALQADGKIITVGTSDTSGYIARYTIDGELDQTFNNSGFVFFAPTGTTNCGINTVAIEPTTQKIIVGGQVTISSVKYAFIAQYTTSGSLDTSNFGSGNGYVTFTISDNVLGLALQSNGQIIAACQLIITCYYSNGTLNTSFGTSNGYTTLPTNSSGRCMGIQADDKIVVGGKIVASSINQFFIARYTSSGLLDTSTFNSPSGYVASQIGSNAQAIALVVQDDQKIVLVGYSNITGTSFYQQYATAARYTTNGSLDTTTFNTPYGYILPRQQWFQAVALQEDQQIICGGFGAGYATYVTRLTTEGLVDTTFNITSTTTPPNSIIRGVAVQSDGKIIITGQNSSTNLYNILARYLGGTTPTSANNVIEMYSQNSSFISEFLYNDFYATVITDTTARAATITAINAILTNYAADYSNQPNFNFIFYLYLLQSEFDAAQIALTTAYPDSYTEINQFFVYLAKRIVKLSAS